MKTARVDQYWRETWGLSEGEYGQSGTIVVPHSKKLAGRSACWIFLHGQGCIVSVPSEIVQDVQGRVQGMPAEMMLDERAMHRVFPGRVSRVVGPSYQGFVELTGFRPFRGRDACTISVSGRDEVRAFRNRCNPAEWDDSGLNEDSEPLFGCCEDRKLIALAGTIPWASYAANVGILVHPSHRGNGYGRAVASAAMSHILSQASVVLYQTLLANHAAVRIAEALGCRLYGQMMFVGLN